ncbi:hypothetical protein CSUB01_10155 [Colletotrichum sublineola]|uniref:Transposase Helix-turn-helix domain-containing protein n=1 Tax=Colletotrichum sublineola TaxID=1173701 RepID=A0A066X2G9_COLSU|nr:hypothetical protein CSUB01_10155 [Colletotrichum sublineola]
MDNYHEILMAVAAAAATVVSASTAAVVDDTLIHDNEGKKQYIHPGGVEYARQIADFFLSGSEEQFRGLFRIGKPDFYRLSVEQKLMVLLYVLGQGESQRNTAHLFQMAHSTVSAIIQQLLPAIVTLHTEVVTLPGQQYVSPSIELSPRDYCFTGCIRAVDGTLVKAHIPLQQPEAILLP